MAREQIKKDDIELVDDVELGEDDELEIEVVDDTPPEDQGRKPLPKEVVEDLENDDDEIKEYSAGVKKRISALKKAWHDERREKERYQREAEEATTMGQRLYQERKQLRAQLSQGETWALSEAKQRAALELKAAKSDYREAYNEGDADKMTEAQERLSRATSHHDQVTRMQPRFALQDDKDDVYNEPEKSQNTQQSAKPDQKTLEWGKRNSWFGSDREMTSFSLGVHQTLVEGGTIPGTDEYFEKLDSRMKKVFPEYFDDGSDDNASDDTIEVDTEESPKRKRLPATNVAPVSRTPKGKKVVLTRTQVATAKRLGITPKEYALELQALNNQE